MLTKDEYIHTYEKYGKTINQMNKPKNPLNKKQLETLYNKYVKTETKKLNKTFGDNKLNEVYTRVDIRDSNSCRLLNLLTPEEYNYIYMSADNYFLTPIDHAHVYPRSTHPHLKYEEDNIVLLSRLFHSRLDQFQDPVTGQYIGPEMCKQWWNLILGPNQVESLNKKIRRANG